MTGAGGASAKFAVVTDCVFCNILDGKIPAEMLASSVDVAAFRDNAPGAPTHVLIVPRRHIVDIGSVGPEDSGLLAAMVELGTLLAKVENVDQSGYRLVFNVGEDGGNTVPHLHMHLLGGRRLGWPPG